jgi:hypothetical protein
VIDECAYGDAGHELRHAADVVGVKVREQHVVDPVNAGFLRSGNNAVGIAAIVFWPAGIDKQRFARGSDKERRLATFDIDEIYLQLTFALCDACGADAG